MQRPEWLRPPYLAVGALAAALAGWLVPATGPLAKGVMVVFTWGFCAYGAWSMRELWQVLAEFAQDIAGRRRQGAAAHPARQGPAPELPAPVQELVRQRVALMARHGVFKPEAPDAALLFAALADNGGGAGPEDILAALDAASSHHPDARPESWTANLSWEHGHAEQEDEALKRQLADIVRLSDGALQVANLHIGLLPRAGHADSREVQVQIRMRVNGEQIELDYPGHLKYLSTHLQHALALRLARLGLGRRLAWLDTGESLALSVLPEGAVEALNQALHLGPHSSCRWAWVDEQAPVSAGDTAVPAAA